MQVRVLPRRPTPMQIEVTLTCSQNTGVCTYRGIVPEDIALGMVTGVTLSIIVIGIVALIFLEKKLK